MFQDVSKMLTCNLNVVVVAFLSPQHEADLHSLARALLEQETLNSKQITDILGVQPIQEEEPVAVGVSGS